MQCLGLVEDHEVISEQQLERYTQIFSKPLSPVHIAALAALFGWQPPVPGEAPHDVAMFSSVATSD